MGLVNEKQATLFGGCVGICQIRSGDREWLSDVVVGTNRRGAIRGMDWHAEEQLAPMPEGRIGNLEFPVQGNTITVNFVDYYPPCEYICQPQIDGWQNAIQAAAPEGVDVEIHWYQTINSTREWIP